MELTQDKIFEIKSKSDAACNAFIQNVLNEVVDINIIGIGWKQFRVVDNSQYVIIAQPIEGDSPQPYWQISKSHIVCINSNKHFENAYSDLVTKGVKEIAYNEEQAKNRREKAKNKPPFKSFNNPQDKPAPQVLFKPKKREFSL